MCNCSLYSDTDMFYMLTQQTGQETVPQALELEKAVSVKRQHDQLRSWLWCVCVAVSVCMRPEHINTRREPNSRFDTTCHLQRLTTQVDAFTAVVSGVFSERLPVNPSRFLILCHFSWCCSFDSGHIAADSRNMVLISRERVVVDCRGNRGIKWMVCILFFSPQIRFSSFPYRGKGSPLLKMELESRS